MQNFMFNKSAKNIFIILAIIIFATPALLLAQSTGTTGNTTTSSGTTGGVKPPITIINPFKQDTIQGLIETIVNDILIKIGGVIAVLMIMYAGFLFVTARGDTTKITKAKDALLYTVIGAAILLGAWVISQAIQNTIDQLRKP